jgi:histone-arginine methyltransferase CARM1
MFVGNMLADYVRTSTYQNAFLLNNVDFTNKVVLDVGTGTGILAFFAIQAGASFVYAIDASESVNYAKLLAKQNGFDEKILFIQGKVEDIDIPEKVDIIISEPIGFLLVHERMLESYVIARDRFLKPDGLMFPSIGSIVLAPMTDEALHKDQLAKIDFWNNTNFYGIDLSAVSALAHSEYFSQPIVGYVSPLSLISAHRTVHSIDFSAVSTEELRQFEVPFSFLVSQTALMHGLAGWFDIEFAGSSETVTLSTAPESPITHWYQCKMLFKEPLAVNKGQTVSGVMRFAANPMFSYDIFISARIDGTAPTIQTENKINLKDQVNEFHFFLD